MKFTIDTEEIKKRSIPKEVFFHTLCLYFKSNINDDVRKEANCMGYNIKDINNYTISIGGVNMIEDVFAVSANNKYDETRYRDIAQAMVKMYPKGFKPGTSAYWVSSILLVEHRLKLLENRAEIELTKEQALQATTEYIESFHDDTHYMQTLPNFILKVVRNAEGDVEWNSNLLSIIERQND